MGVLAKWRREKRPFLLWSPKKRMFSLVWFAWRPGIAEDVFNKRAWELAPDLDTYTLNTGKKEYRVNVLDEERGIGVYFEPHEELMKIRSNPELSGQLIDATMLTQALQLQPSRKQIIIAAIAALLVGIIFGLSMGG